MTLDQAIAAAKLPVQVEVCLVSSGIWNRGPANRLWRYLLIDKAGEGWVIGYTAKDATRAYVRLRDRLMEEKP